MSVEEPSPTPPPAPLPPTAPPLPAATLAAAPPLAPPPAPPPAPPAPHVDFELGEDAPQNREARRRQEEAWEATAADARHHYSLREALQLQRPSLLHALADFDRVRAVAAAWRASAPADGAAGLTALSAETLELIVEAAMPGQAPLLRLLTQPRPPPPPPPANFRVFARVRPLSERERGGGEFEAIAPTSPHRLVVHDGRLARSGRRLTMVHRWYSCDGVYSPLASDAEVNAAVLLPLMRRVTSGQGDATVVLYGQTGAGKTHTLMGMVGHVVAELELRGKEGEGVEVLFFEVATGGCHDLLNRRGRVVLRSDENEQVHARGAKTCVVRTGAELHEVLSEALAMRSTVETEANPISSRSHAICSLRFTRGGRTLRLVDLAGSERNYETHHMTSRTFQRESAAINESLMALKDCFRAAARQRNESCRGLKQPVRIPYRSSMLTRVLRDCFADATHRTALVAAIAPGAESVLHTFNTLDHVTLMAPHLNKLSCEVDLPMHLGARRSYAGVPVREWSAAQVIEWLAVAEGGRFSYVWVPPGTDGAALLAMDMARLTEMVELGTTVGRRGADVAWALRSGARVGQALFAALRQVQ